MSIPLQLPDGSDATGEGNSGEMGGSEQRTEKRRRTERSPGSSDESPGDKNLIDGIPDDCLLLVFSLLPTPRDRCRCAAVSKKWFRMQVLLRRSDFRASAWLPPAREISRCVSGSDANDWRLGAMAIGNGAFGSLTDLSVTEDFHPLLPRQGDAVRRHISDAGLFVIARACSKLKKLSLLNCISVSSRGIGYVAHNCSALKKLELGHATAITDHGLVFLAARCFNLETLILTECPSITDTSLLAFSSRSTTRLRSFEICHCPRITDRGIVSIVTTQTRLERVEISLMKLGDGVLRAVASHGKSIRLLALDKVWGLTSAGYCWIGEARGVKTLQLDGCEGMTDGCIRMLSPYSFAGLRKVTMRSCSSLSDASLFSLTQLAVGLENLHLESLRAFTYRGLVLALRNCSHSLKVLALVDCSFQGHGPELQQAAEAAFLRLPRQCLMLRTVRVESCVGIGDDFAAWIGQACRGVTRVSFLRMDSITDQGITSMMKKLHGYNNITRLDFTGCAQLSNRSVWSVTRECRHRLTHLILNGCLRVSDRGAQVITKRCTGLVELDLSRCNITDSAVVKLIEEDPPDLEVLSLGGCTRITDRSLEVLDEYGGLGLARLDLTGCTGLTSEQADFMNIYVDQVDL